MKAIILAAGKGTRLSKYTQNLPKGMLPVFNKPIIHHQVEAYRRNGITDITVIKGYCAEKIDIPGTKTYFNPRYNETNMVESLFCAAVEIEGDVIISYSDVLFEDKVLKTIMDSMFDIGVLVDTDWKDYWLARYDSVNFDTESLEIDSNGKIVSLGVPDPPLAGIDGRYVGMIKLSAIGSEKFRSTYQKGKAVFEGKEWLSGRLFEKIYMTDFIQELIKQKNDVYSILIRRGWLEFDTNEDYERVVKLYFEDKLKDYFVYEI